MELNILVSADKIETLDAIFNKIRKYRPDFTERMFLEQIIEEWLEPYQRKKEPVLSKDQIILKSNLKKALELSNKTIMDVAREIGIHRSYLHELIKGKFIPSVVIALLLSKSLNYPIEDLFYLEPIS